MNVGSSNTMHDADLHRTLNRVTANGTRIDVDGRSLLHFGGNDYLSLSSHPAVIAAMVDATHEHGAGAGASPLISGWTTIHDDLARRLASWKQVERAIVTSTGYAANLASITSLIGADDHVVADRLNHASLHDALRLTGARVRHYRHRDVRHANERLERAAPGARRFIVTDGIFSMEGTRAPLDRLVDLAGRHDAMLIVDDAHGSGVVGPNGRGTAASFHLDGMVDVIIGTMSKAFGAQGGFIAASSNIIDHIVNHGRAFIYSTALATPVAAACRAALDVIEWDEDRRRRRGEHQRRLMTSLEAQGWTILGEVDAPMFAVMIGAPSAAIEIADRLREAGVFAPAIRPPTVRPNASRLRLSVTAGHSSDDIDRTIDAFARVRDGMILA